MRGLRMILIAGFGGILLIFGVAAMEAVRLLGAVRAENQKSRAASVERARELDTVKYCVLLSQKYINQVPSEAQEVADLRSQWTRMMSDLAAYHMTGDPEQFEELRQMLRQHWQSLDHAISDSLTPDEVRPLRISAVEITARVEDIDAKQAAATEIAVQNQVDRLGKDLAVALNVALAAALVLAVGCGLYILSIERQNRGRYEEILAARHDLERLSARLVDAQETERRTISRELHDQVGQTLNAVLVDAANLASRIPPDDEVGQRYLQNIRSYADASVNSIRDISLLLRPSMLDDLGLIAALEWQARETSRRTGIDVRVNADGVDESLPDPLRTCVYRVVQEALQNVSKHSHATHARVDVRQTGETLELRVEDDGQGFDPKRSRGMGLLGMEERVRQLDGRVDVSSVSGKGTTVSVTLPAPVRVATE
jgi:signal transduction histidine kinase